MLTILMRKGCGLFLRVMMKLSFKTQVYIKTSFKNTKVILGLNKLFLSFLQAVQFETKSRKSS